MEHSSTKEDRPDIGAFDLAHVPGDFTDDPYRYFRALRAKSPVHRNPDGSYILTRYAEVEAAYRDPAVWSSDKKADFFPKFGESPLYEHHTTSVVFTDPPDHTRIRRLFQAAFTRKALAAFEPRITALVDGYLDRLADQKQMEVVEEFSFRLPIEVVCDLLGVPHGDRALLRGWANAILTALEPTITTAQMQAGNQAVLEFKEYLRDLIAHRRTHRRAYRGRAKDTEVLTVLADAQADGQSLTETELLHQCIFMLNAGHETSTNMLSHGIHELLRHPDQIAALRTDPALIDTCVDEVLRYQAPIQINNRRLLVSQRVAGIPLPAGTNVHMIVASANRDGDHFPDPDRFDIARRPNRHLSFGLGVHICAGNALARLEAVIAFGRLFARFPTLGLVGPPQIAPRIRFREITRLDIALG